MTKTALLMILLAAPAWAERTRPAETARPQHYDFDDDVVEGGTLQPEGLLVDGKRRIKHSSLIKIRETFVPEMLKSAEDQ